MTIGIMCLVAIGAYAAGIFTMAALQYRGGLDELIAADLVPPRPPLAPPPQAIEHERTSPYGYAPRPKPPGAATKPAHRRQIHWPIARAEPEKPPPMVKVEPKPQAAIPPPKPPIATSTALPDIEFGRSP